MAADSFGWALLPACVFAAGDSDCRPNPPLLIHSTVMGKFNKHSGSMQADHLK